MIHSRRSAGRSGCRLSHGSTGIKAEADRVMIHNESGKENRVLRLGEAQAQPLQRDPAALADDEMIEQLDIEQLSGRHDLDGEGDVGCGGRRVAGGVVVDGDDGGGLLTHRVAKDLSLPS